MDKVDFGYLGALDITIYRMCFQKYANAELSLEVPITERAIMLDKTRVIHGLSRLCIFDQTSRPDFTMQIT